MFSHCQQLDEYSMGVRVARAAKSAPRGSDPAARLMQCVTPNLVIRDC